MSSAQARSLNARDSQFYGPAEPVRRFAQIYHIVRKPKHRKIHLPVYSNFDAGRPGTPVAIAISTDTRPLEIHVSHQP